MPTPDVAPPLGSAAAQMLALHAALTMAGSGWDAYVSRELWGLPISLALEAFVVWRAWRGGRIIWWLVTVLQLVAVPFLAYGLRDPVWIGYQTDTATVHIVGMLVLLVAGLVVWLSPSLRRHVFARGDVETRIPSRT